MRENKYVLIAGCRDYNNYAEAKRYINRCIAEIRKRYKITVISGGARGTVISASYMQLKTDLM